MINPTNPNSAMFSVAVPAALGGGSVVNGMAYMQGSQADYYAWEEFGNPGWDWHGLLLYFCKSSRFIPPSPEAAKQWT
jgi:choline dehydrogenase-like flavoprotein